jgi:hypothetical protein
MEQDRLLLLSNERLVDYQIEATERERREFAAESKRLRAAARTLAEESQRLQTQAGELQQKTLGRLELLADLKLEKILCCLSRNDPDTTVVDIAAYKVFEGYGKSLGEALQGNSFVSELILDVQNILPQRSDAVSFPLIDLLLQFIATSTLLRHVELRNSASDLFPRMYTGVSDNLMGTMLDAIVQNSHIGRLTLNLPHHVTWLPKIASANMSLTALTLRFSTSASHKVADRDVPTVATCIASLSYLEYFELIVRTNESLCIAILTELNRVNSRLRHLRLELDHAMSSPFFAALSQLVVGSATILDLVLPSTAFFETDMEDVLLGLKHINVDTGVTTMFVPQLTFLGCDYSNDEMYSIASFLQTRIGHNGESSCQSALNELRFDSRSRKRFDSLLLQCIADSLLMAKDSDTDTSWVPTIGSTVRSVSLVGGVNRAFLDRLGLNSDRVRLEKLHLARLSQVASRSLGVWLPKLQSLKELKLAVVAPGGPWWIVRGLRQNGTLLSVETTDANGDGSFDAVQSRMVEAYCERNRVLGELLDNETGLVWHMLPSLRLVARQTPSIQVTHLLRGLLRHDEKTSESQPVM